MTDGNFRHGHSTLGIGSDRHADIGDHISMVAGDGQSFRVVNHSEPVKVILDLLGAYYGKEQEAVR